MIGLETIGNTTVTVFDDMPILCTDPWLTGSPYMEAGLINKKFQNSAG